MVRNLLFTSFLLLNVIGVIFPSKKENTKLFDFCYSLEKILIKNSIQNTQNESYKVNSISKDILNFGVSKTRYPIVSIEIKKNTFFKLGLILKMPQWF